MFLCAGPYRSAHRARGSRIMAAARYAAASLVTFASALLERTGARADIARDVADVLVAGDLLGHTTHGLALLSPYLGELEKGAMAGSGAPTVVNSRPAVATWDGSRLPGPRLTLRPPAAQRR